MCDLAGHWREADLSGLLVRSLLRQRRWCVSPSISGDAPAELLRIRIPRATSVEDLRRTGARSDSSSMPKWIRKHATGRGVTGLPMSPVFACPRASLSRRETAVRDRTEKKPHSDERQRTTAENSFSWTAPRTELCLGLASQGQPRRAVLSALP